MAAFAQGLPRLTLASASPRRAELLAEAGYAFDVRPVDIDEKARPGEDPLSTCQRLAEEKARAAAQAGSSGLIVAGDTVVVLDGLLLGKPADEADAAAMLQSLSGREHRVASALAVLHPPSGRLASGVDTSQVRFDRLSQQALAAYLRGGEWRDKAGAYAIQGEASRFAHLQSGRLDTVIGFPLPLLQRLLAGWQALLCLLLLFSCGREPSVAPTAATTAELQVGGKSVQVELATDDEGRARGLMHRTHLADDQGMLFLFADSRPRTFWMKNTLIALDIVFLDEQGRVINICEAPPGVERPGFSSSRSARFVLELRQGWCREHGLQDGDTVPIAPELAALGRD